MAGIERRRVHHFPFLRAVAWGISRIVAAHLPLGRRSASFAPIQRMDELMDTLLLLIAINFLTVPFLQEAEAQGRRLQRFPGVPWILRLAHVRRAHWFRPFCILAFFFLAVAAMQTPAGRVDVSTLLVHFVIMQVVLWAVVVLSVRKHAKKVLPAGGGAASDHAGDHHLIAPRMHIL
jgi:hypothetical protein